MGFISKVKVVGLGNPKTFLSGPKSYQAQRVSVSSKKSFAKLLMGEFELLKATVTTAPNIHDNGMRNFNFRFKYLEPK